MAETGQRGAGKQAVGGGAPGGCAAFIYDARLADVRLPHVEREEHPLRPVRVRYTYELLDAYGAFDGRQAALVAPEPATEADVLTVHSRDYVDAVRALSQGRALPHMDRYGFGPLNLLPFPGMYEWALLTVGATLAAARLVAAGQVPVAFSPASGVNHHAHRSRSHGFGIFNDAAIAIARLSEQGLRVAYVDIDLHHGDGVEAAFADTDQVLTISLHESTQYIFPGPPSGEVERMGTGRGRGCAVNVPLAPYTDDEVYLWAFREVVPPLLERFAPDVVVTQLGADAHYTDPLWPWHLYLTTHGYEQVVRELSRLAPRWVAVGGGGYSVFAVARCWALAFAVMGGRSLPDEVPEAFGHRYQIRRLHDTDLPEIGPAIRERARRFAEATVAEIKRLVFPIHGL